MKERERQSAKEFLIYIRPVDASKFIAIVVSQYANFVWISQKFTFFLNHFLWTDDLVTFVPRNSV